MKWGMLVVDPSFVTLPSLPLPLLSPDISLKGTSIDFLFLVFHGGSIMDPISDRVGKTLDFSSLQNNLKTITDLHFRSAIGRIAMRMVPCKNICNIAFRKICDVSLCVCVSLCVRV